MQLILTILGGIATLLGWVKSNKDQKIGSDEQKVADLKSSLELQQQEDIAAANAPHTAPELQNQLDKGTF